MDDGIKKLSDRLKDHMLKEQPSGDKVSHFIPKASSYYDYYPDQACDGEEIITTGDNASSTQIGNRAENTQHQQQNDNANGLELDEGMIEFTKIRLKEHLDIIQDELIGRGISIPQEDSNKINALKKLLKKNEVARRNLKKNPKHFRFRPLHTPYCSYNINKSPVSLSRDKESPTEEAIVSINDDNNIVEVEDPEALTSPSSEK